MFYILILSSLLTCRAQFADELQSYERECLGEDKYTCLDGSCIKHEQYCDGSADCADGSDENFCPDRPPNEHLCNITHQFLCRDGHACIPATWVCNGEPDCTDASDEANCTALPEAKNTSANNCGKGFRCGDGTCISSLWACDGHYDCDDRSDEDIETTCRHSLNAHTLSDGRSCYEYSPLGARRYRCLDSSFCLSAEQMCDNITDCRDESDEGPFCAKWHSMCVNTTCPTFTTKCTPERSGPQCTCNPSPNTHYFNETTKKCEDVDECQAERPNCSHRCKNFEGHFRCECEPGYVADDFQYLCFAEEPKSSVVLALNTHYFDENINKCEDVDECQAERPNCSHRCKNFEGHFRCECEPGYVADDFEYLCFAEEPKSSIVLALNTHYFDENINKCEDVDECQAERPNCSHRCKNFEGHFRCECEPGYVADDFEYLCFAEEPKSSIVLALNTHYFDENINKCEDVDECQAERPNCSHRCKNFEGHFRCECEPGYVADDFQYLCFAEGQEAMLFYSTEKDIRYIKVKTKQEVIVATGIKKSHGVSYDGKYLYWVETAEGHQAIARAHLDNFAETKEILVSLGLYDAGDIAVDWVGKNIYFSDASRGAIYVCKADGSMCARVHTATLRPKFVTLDVNNGLMYWADVAGLQGGHVIMRSRMDGSDHEVMTASLEKFASGLALDAPNDRLYFVDRTVMVLKVDTKQIYPLFQARLHHPYAIAVFENTVYWSDWTSNTIQTTDKLHLEGKRSALATLHAPVYGMHIYHPILFSRDSNPCANKCSHLCLLKSNTTYACVCPTGMTLNGSTCYNQPNYRPQYLVVGAGASFTRIQYDTLGNPEAHATHFDIGRVQAMAYDSKRDTLYIYDGMRKSIVKIEMADFTLGVTHVFAYNGLENVVDMDYDYVTDNLYVLDSGRRSLEVFSLKDGKRALLHRFPDQEIPVSFCLLQHFGRLLVAVVESEQNNEIHVDSIGLDGDEREHQHVITNNLKGPRVRLRNLHDSDMVAISDEGSNSIEFIHLRTLPRGVRQDIRKRLPTAAISLAVTLPFVFWSDGRTPRVFWDEYLGETSTPRRVELSIFPNETHLHFQATTPENRNTLPHPCARNPCSHICVQTPTLPILGIFPAVAKSMDYKCLCPPGTIKEGGSCNKLAECKGDQAYCYKSNECIPFLKRCDGEKDCKNGEDEEDCSPSTPGPKKCLPTEVECNGVCIQYNEICPQEVTESFTPPFYCEFDQFKCRDSKVCLEREQVCDKHQDCPDGSDEGSLCHTLRCLDTEFMCAAGNCILGSWRCDGDADCTDGSDEADCTNRTCNVGSYQCLSGQCVDIQRRCDGQLDCFDGSDEERCQEPIPDPSVTVPSCGDGELPCELNKTICLPQTAWCNNKDDCPGGTDEHGCTSCAARGQFECKQEQRCLSMRSVCNHNKDCKDGSDETPEACDLVNRTSRVFLPPPYPPAECHHGFLCRTGQCIEWREVCDQTPDCFDGSDENGQCCDSHQMLRCGDSGAGDAIGCSTDSKLSRGYIVMGHACNSDGFYGSYCVYTKPIITACENTTCTDRCQATPLGPQCACKPGFQLRPDLHSCADIDECSHEPCSHLCLNFPGSFLCSCRRGFTLRSDRRSCKANVQAVKSILFATEHSVRSISDLGRVHVEFGDESLGTIADVDVDFGKQKFYVTSPKTGKLIEVTPLPLLNGTSQNVITNIGSPTKLAVDWVTGNVYFVDNSTEPSIKVCHFEKKRCARVKGLPADGTVTSLVLSPETRKLYYAINYKTTSEVTSVDLGGTNEMTSKFPGPSAGLAVDGSELYVASKIELWSVDPGRSYRAKSIREWHRLTPESISIFEDYVFVLSGHRIFRCLTFELKFCIPFIAQMPKTQDFVIWHPSIQTKFKNECDGFVCESVCVLVERGPRCICEDGTVSKDGGCSLLGKSVVPLFNGVPSQNFVQEHQVSVTLVTITLLLFAMYLAIFVYYHCVYRPRKETVTLPVRFQNQTSVSGSTETPTIEMPTTSGSRHEFVNPLQFVRDVWRRSLRNNRPIGTAGLSFDIPRPTEDLSDTESDLDYKDERNLIR